MQAMAFRERFGIKMKIDRDKILEMNGDGDTSLHLHKIWSAIPSKGWWREEF